MLILFTYFLISLNLFSQENAPKQNSSEVLYYNIGLFFPYSIIHQYRVDEETEVERTYESGDTYTYKKRLTWYVSFYAPNISSKEGEKEIFVSIDSLDYEFKDKNYDVSYHNSSEGVPPLRVWDFEKTFYTNSKEFFMYYDAYNNAYDVKSEGIDAELKNLKKYEGKNAEFKKAQVSNRLDENSLKFIADPVKGLLPTKSVALDSSWKTSFNLDIDFVSFGNVCSATLSKVADANYYISMKADTLYCIDSTMLFDDIKKIANIDAGIASGNLELSISSKGHVKYLSTNFSAEIYGKVDNLKFIEKKKSRVNWNLVKMLQQY